MSAKGSSSVDYAVVSENLLPSVQFFKTKDFNCFSDHLQIELSIKCNITWEKSKELDSSKWNHMQTINGQKNQRV